MQQRKQEALGCSCWL